MTMHSDHRHPGKAGRARTLAVFLYLTILVSPGAWARAATPWPCGEHPNALKDQQGKDVWLDPETLEKRAIRRVEPKLPSSLRVDSKVIVDIILGPSGTVLCARALDGHPILRAAAAEAALGWTFKPYRVKGKAVEVFGHLSMEISTGSRH